MAFSPLSLTWQQPGNSRASAARIYSGRLPVLPTDAQEHGMALSSDQAPL